MKNALRRNAIALAQIALTVGFIALMFAIVCAASSDPVVDVRPLVWLSTLVILGMLGLQAATLHMVSRGRTSIEHLSLSALVPTFCNAVNCTLCALTIGVPWIAAPAIALVPFALQVGFMIVRVRREHPGRKTTLPSAVLAGQRQ